MWEGCLIPNARRSLFVRVLEELPLASVIPSQPLKYFAPLALSPSTHKRLYITGGFSASLLVRFRHHYSPASTILAYATTLSAGTTASSDRYAFVPAMRTAPESVHGCVDAVPAQRFAATTKRSLHFVFHLFVLIRCRPRSRSCGQATILESRRRERDWRSGRRPRTGRRRRGGPAQQVSRRRWQRDILPRRVRTPFNFDSGLYR